MAHNHDNLGNAAESGIIGMIVSFLLNEVMPWTLHTLGALLSGAVVAIGLFFLNRYLKKRYK